MPSPGVSRAIRAFGLGNVTEEQAANAELRRLTAARTASARMDDIVSRANISARKDESQGRFQEGSELSDIAKASVIGGFAPGVSAFHTGEATRMENEVQAEAIKRFFAGDLPAEASNAFHALIGRGAFIKGPDIDPIEDSRLEQERVTAMTNKANREVEFGGRGRPTEESMFSAFDDINAERETSGSATGTPANMADYFDWLAGKISENPETRSNNATFSKYIAEKRAALAPDLSRINIDGAVPGTTIETAIPAESLQQPPAIGTWIIVNGRPQKYKGQR